MADAPKSVKMSKISGIDCLTTCLLLNLQRFFRMLGVRVATNPVVCLILSIFAALLCSVGFFKLEINENLKTGYTSIYAPSRREYRIYQEFFENSGEPYFAGVFIQSKDGGNLLRKPYFDASKELFDNLMNNLSIVSKIKKHNFKNLCLGYCRINDPVWIFKDALQSRLKAIEQNHSLSSDTELNYPIATVSGFKLNIAPYFHGISLSPNRVTSISNSTLLALWFRSDHRSEAFSKLLAQWELALYEFIQDFRSPYLSLIPYGEAMINGEVLRGGIGTVPFYTFGLTILTLFVMVTVACSSVCHGESTKAKALLGFATVLSPLLASIVTFGFITFLGIHLNVMSLVTPFLVMAIGVDDAFLIIHSWQRHNKSHASLITVEQHLGLVFAEVGPSIAVTSLTNSLAFAIGAAVPTPELRLFCLGASLGMTLDFIYQLTFFSPILVLCGKNEINKSGVCSTKVSTLCTSWLSTYCKALSSLTVRLFGLATFVAFLTISVWGMTSMKAEMDAETLLPRDSVLTKAIKVHEEYLWKEYQPVTVIVNSPPDITNESDYGAFNEMVRMFETLPKSLGPDVTFLWLRDYEQFLESQKMFDSFMNFGMESDLEEKLDYQSIPSFLESPFYSYWNECIVWREESKRVKVDKFFFRVGYGRLSSMGQQAQLLQKLRKLALQQSQFNLSLWEPSAPMCDVILAVKDVTIRTVVITLGCMSLVCILFVPNLWSIVCAIGAVASICVGVLGFLHWWSVNLDPITMAFAIMAVGFSVDYTTHISYHFYKISKLECQFDGTIERLFATLDSVAWPMIQAGISTVICMAPLALAPLPAYVVLLKTVVLVVVLGLWHGLFIIPVILAALPEKCTVVRVGNDI